MSAGISLEALSQMSTEDRAKALAQAMSTASLSSPPSSGPAEALAYGRTQAQPTGVLSDADVQKYKKMVQASPSIQFIGYPSLETNNN
jgi:hypothetical protein